MYVPFRHHTITVSVAAGVTEPVNAAEKVAEDAAEDIFEARERGWIEPGAGLRRHTRMAEPVVLRALLAVRQDRVGLGGLLESLFGLVVPLVPIRMMFEGELAIGALDLLVSRILQNAENLVVIPFAHAFATFTMAGRTSLSPSR